MMGSMLRAKPNYFNPRTREGCDPGANMKQNRPLTISIHAPVKGATPITMPPGRAASTFQSTHP